MEAGWRENLGVEAGDEDSWRDGVRRGLPPSQPRPGGHRAGLRAGLRARLRAGYGSGSWIWMNTPGLTLAGCARVCRQQHRSP